MLVYTLKPLEPTELLGLLRRAWRTRIGGLGRLEVEASDEVLLDLAARAGGDARQALLRLEACVQAVAVGGGGVLDREAVERVTGRAQQRYDRAAKNGFIKFDSPILSGNAAENTTELFETDFLFLHLLVIC